MALTPILASGALALAAPAALPAAVPPAGDAATAVDVVRTDIDRHDRMTVPVRIGHQGGSAGPFDFLVDTGAERTVLARDIAQRLRLPTSGQGLLIGIAGTQSVDLVEIEEINLGRRSFYGLTAPLLEGYNIGADGIIGLDSLQDQRVLLDFDKKRMSIGDAMQLGGSRGFEIVVQARRRSGQLIMTNAVIDGVRTDIVIDTGSDTSIGNRALQKALAKRRKGETTQLQSVTGQVITADIAMARTLKLGTMTMSNSMMVFADTPAFEKLELVKRPALFMGMNQLKLFHRVAIDFATKRILFDLPSSAEIPFRF
ncbi:MAG: retroviral-like aspartic protease family protein [Novosphingobium sp.]|uniref:retroviral-like aspartic protease family protein n=1 Tax=Novosphingobium sp. TaxID=1874826 RepID=UPI00301A6BF3